jgi:hypothetical protein
VKTTNLFLAGALAAAILAGCGAGTGSSPSDAFPYAQQPAPGTITAAFSNAPQSVQLPPAAGFTGTVYLPAATTGSGVTVTLYAGISPPGTDPVISPTQTGNGPAPIPLIYLGLTPAASVALPSLPSFTIVLPAYIATGPNFFLGLYDPANQLAGYALGSEGPATVTGSTLTFAAPLAPIRLQANQTYALSLYAVPTPPPAGNT